MARFKAFDSESDDDDQQSDASQTHQPAHSSPQKVPQPLPRRASYSSSVSSSSLSPESIEEDAEESEEDSIMDEDELLPAMDQRHDELDEDDEPRPWAQQLDLEPRRVHVMQTSLFRVPELAKENQKEPSPFLKHSRPADVHGELKAAPARTSFATPRPHPPARKYTRVTLAESVASGHERIYIDAGLSFGNSFRVGWGPKNMIGLVGKLGAESMSSEASQSIVTVCATSTASTSSADLLQQLLSNSSIQSPSDDNMGTPIAIASRDLEFSSFAELFPPADTTHDASVFRLAHSLFDHIDLHLGKSVTTDIRNRVTALRRAEELSVWLSRTVSQSVESDLKTHAMSDSCRVAFLHLTGNQVEKAVEVLINSGNVRLANLISQVPGDIDFRVDIREQLQIWREEKATLHIKKDIRKLYALASGDINFQDESDKNDDDSILKGLDWLRVFGLQLWFSSMLDTPLRETFEAYEQLIKDYPGQVACPAPWYLKTISKDIPPVTDGLFNIMKLALSPSMTLESSLNPLSFSSNPCDYRLPWLLYIVLSQCLRLRDFTDRQLQDAAMNDTSDSFQDPVGYSQTANTLTLNFAAQLEQEGLVQEAAFVLLFLEDDIGRKRAIKDLLGRSAPHLNNWNIAGLQGSLMIPREWIDEALATHALYNGDVYLAYDLYIRAKEHYTAHDLAITYLAPEAILRDDLELLSSLFTVLDENLVEDFGVGGQLFIDYVNILSRVPELREKLQADDAIPDASEASELELLTGRIPKLIGILPDILQNKTDSGERCAAALSHMLSKLLDCLDPTRPMRLDIESGLVDEEARLRYINSSACGSFLRTIAAMP